MRAPLPPRSLLHALAPHGLGSPEVESLASYFCRLAHSHGMTAQHLAGWVLDYFGQQVCDKYGWHQRRLGGLSAESEQWAAWLAELTGVGALDRLTLAPWRHLLGNPGLAPASDRWCPHCLAEDRAAGRSPYLRLAWEVAPVTVCLRHKVQLVSACPHCGRGNVRNRAAIVVPGWCTACGGFLGDAGTVAASPESLWTAGQVGEMVRQPPQVSAAGVVPLLETVIERMAAGRIVGFARRYGFSQSGVWSWLRQGCLPGLRAWLTIASRGGIGLGQLFAGEVAGWELPQTPAQAEIPLPASPRAGIRSRERDWETLRSDLEAMRELAEPISVYEACRRLGIERKQAYLRLNAEARALADRYRRHRAGRVREREAELRAGIGAVLDERLDAGYAGVSAREVWERLGEEARGVGNVFRHIRAVRAERDG